MSAFRAIAAVLCLGLVPGACMAGLSEDDILRRPLADIERMLPDEHPTAYYLYAARLFQEGRKDDSVFWFYAGQLRYRFYLSANPGLPPDGDPAVMSSLNATIGQTINEYAGGDVQLWSGSIDRALAWDAATDNGFTSKTAHNKQWNEVRTGLSQLRDMITSQADQIRAQRAKARMPNR